MLEPCPDQSFVLGDGQVPAPLGKATFTYVWHDTYWWLKTFVMDDKHLAFPLILGLDFLSKTQTRIHLGENEYGVRDTAHNRYQYHPSYPTLKKPSPGKMPILSYTWLCHTKNL